MKNIGVFIHFSGSSRSLRFAALHSGRDQVVRYTSSYLVVPLPPFASSAYPLAVLRLSPRRA